MTNFDIDSYRCMEEDIHNEFTKHIGAACISYNAQQLANEKLFIYRLYNNLRYCLIVDVWRKIFTMNS